MESTRTAAIVSVHMDLGAGRRGVDMGPSAIRLAGLHDELEAIGWRVEECGSIVVEEAEAADAGSANARYAKEITAACSRLHDRIRRALDEGKLPLCLGGDHAVAMGSVSAVAAHHRERGAPIGLIWIDAHTDMNTPETSPSGNIHGMPLAHLLGHGLEELVHIGGDAPAVNPRHVALLGIRSVDRRERALVEATGVRVFTMSEIDRRGIAPCVEEALVRATAGTAGVHLSLDLDGVDPRVAPGVGTPVSGGLTYREAHLCCEEVARSGALLGMDVVELNPVIDARNETGVLAVELVGSALGRTIL
jgi:arginase